MRYFCAWLGFVHAQIALCDAVAKICLWLVYVNSSMPILKCKRGKSRSMWHHPNGIPDIRWHS